MSEPARYNELFRKMAALERRVSKLEHGLQETDTVNDPQGWIGEAFEKVDEDLTDLRNEMHQMNSKIDIILGHITGMSE